MRNCIFIFLEFWELSLYNSLHELFSIYADSSHVNNKCRYRIIKSPVSALLIVIILFFLLKWTSCHLCKFFNSFQFHLAYDLSQLFFEWPGMDFQLPNYTAEYLLLQHSLHQLHTLLLWLLPIRNTVNTRLFGAYKPEKIIFDLSHYAKSRPAWKTGGFFAWIDGKEVQK